MKRLTQDHQTTILTRQGLLSIGLGLLALPLLAFPALAHHPMGGDIPSNALEGFLSGLGHPVIGFDHLLFVIAAGFIGASLHRGMLVPIAFVVASLAGTGLHLQALDLPAPEAIISASVLLFGVMLAQGKQANLGIVAVLGAIAGIFHGYAYGEAIVGAEMTPLVAYLLGFASIQLAISLAAWKVGTLWLNRKGMQGVLNLRFVGFAIGGAGAALLSGVLLG